MADQTKLMEYMGILLYEHKLAASLCCQAAVESADEQCRNHCKGLLDQTLQNQKNLFDLMNQKGWYKVESAPQEQLTRIQQSFSAMQSQMQ